MASGLQQRAMTSEVSDRWHLSQLSFGHGQNWDLAGDGHEPGNGQYHYEFDDSQGEDQSIYIMDFGMNVYKAPGAEHGVSH